MKGRVPVTIVGLCGFDLSWVRRARRQSRMARLHVPAMPDPPGVCFVPPDGVFVVAGGVVVPGGVALGVGEDVFGVGEDVFGVLPGEEVAGPDPGPVDVLVLTGVPPEGVLAGALLVPGSVSSSFRRCEELPMQTGALPFTGALPAMKGASPTAPI